jgi:hypothetical protein
MKNSKITIILIALFAGGILFSACGNSHEGHEHNADDHHEESTKKEDKKQGKEYTSAYICPMHCEGSGSDQPGECPTCGMEYVKNTADTHACPMHPEITGAAGDKCSECGMDLTAITGDEHAGHDH